MKIWCKHHQTFPFPFPDKCSLWKWPTSGSTLVLRSLEPLKNGESWLLLDFSICAHAEKNCYATWGSMPTCKALSGHDWNADWFSHPSFFLAWTSILYVAPSITSLRSWVSICLVRLSDSIVFVLIQIACVVPLSGGASSYRGSPTHWPCLRQIIWRIPLKSIAKRLSLTSPSPRCSKWSERERQSVSFNTLMLSLARTCQSGDEGGWSCKSPSKTHRKCSDSSYPASIDKDSAWSVDLQTRRITELRHLMRAIRPPLFCMKSGPHSARMRPDWDRHPSTSPDWNIMVIRMAGIGDAENLSLVEIKHLPSIGELLILGEDSSSQQSVAIQKVLHSWFLNLGLKLVGVIGQVRSANTNNPIQRTKNTAQLTLFIWSSKTAAILLTASGNCNGPGTFKSMRASDMDALLILGDAAPTKLETCVFQFPKLQFLLNLLHGFLSLLATTPNQIIHVADYQPIDTAVVLEHDIGSILMWNTSKGKLQHGLMERTPKTPRCILRAIHRLSRNQKWSWLDSWNSICRKSHDKNSC